MRIKSKGKEYFVPDEVANDPALTVSQVKSQMIPWDLHLQMERVNDLRIQLEELQEQPDEILVPNKVKEMIPGIEIELNEALSRLEELKNTHGIE